MQERSVYTSHQHAFIYFLLNVCIVLLFVLIFLCPLTRPSLSGPVKCVLQDQHAPKEILGHMDYFPVSVLTGLINPPTSRNISAF